MSGDELMDNWQPPAKAELLDRIDASWTKLNRIVAGLDEGQLTTLRDTSGWTIKDHLAHLTAWEQSLLALLEGRDRAKAAGIEEATDDMDVDDENAIIQRRNADRPLADVTDAFHRSHQAVMARLNAMSDVDLLRSYAHYQPNDPAAPDEAVVGWIIGNTCEHYDEHIGWIGDMLAEQPAANEGYDCLNERELRALYDLELRENVTYHDLRREETPHIVRYIGLRDPESVVLYSDLTADNADDVIRDQIDYFRSLGHSFEWKLFEHDQPSDLRERLQAHGFEIGEAEAIMVLDLHNPPPSLLQPVQHDVRRLDDPDRLDDLAAVNAAVWGDRSGMVKAIAADMREYPESVSVYVAYADGVPAGASRISYVPDSRWAGLWGGATLEQYRGRGLYHALLAVRAQEAIRRGVRFLTIDASPMSRPIVGKLGFQLITMSYPCEWRLEAGG